MITFSQKNAQSAQPHTLPVKKPNKNQQSSNLEIAKKQSKPLAIVYLYRLRATQIKHSTDVGMWSQESRSPVWSHESLRHTFFF